MAIKASPNRRRMATQAERYWTKANIESAKPISLRIGNDRSTRLAPSTGTGSSQVVQGTQPGNTNRQSATTGEVSDYSQYPYSCVGKLFMREGTTNYVGSAWVIGDRAVFSAAHCLFDDNGTFFDDVIFIPQYSNGHEPLGRFALVQMGVDERYANKLGNDRLKYDLGIGLLDRPIANQTGTVSFAKFPTSQIAIGSEMNGVGYPAGSPFDGSRMMQSVGNVVTDDNPNTSIERYFGAENNMTGGCSGGPWFDANNVVVGLNSFVFNNQPHVMYSPYFGQGFADLIEWADQNDGDIPPNNSTDQFDYAHIKEELQSTVSSLNSLIAGIG